METFIEWLEKNNKYDFSNSPNYFKYFSNILIDKIFVDKTIRFTQPNQLNDPLEFNPIIKTGLGEVEDTWYKIGNVLMPSINRWYKLMFVDSQIKYSGVLSLTKNPQLFSMWNYYANGHKGFLLELKQDFNEHEKFKSKSNKIYPIKKVKYVPIFEIDIPKIADRVKNIFTIESLNEILFYNKTERWKDEKEYRLVRSLDDFQPDGNIDEEKIYVGELPFDVLESVVFGACMSIDNKQKIIDILSGTDVKIHQSVIIQDVVGDDSKIGKVLIINGNSLEKKEGFLSNDYWSFEGKKLSNNFFFSKRKVENILIEDLPYYKGFEKVVVDFYNANNR